MQEQRLWSKFPMRKRLLITLTPLVCLAVSSLCAADLVVKVADKEPPKELDASIRAKLQSKAIQLLDGGKPVYEFWFDAEVPLQSKPSSTAKALETIKQATLLGAVSVASDRRD